MPEITEATIKELLNDDATPLKTRTEENGTLVVIAANGMKFKFSPEQVKTAQDKTKPAPKPKPAAKTTQTKTTTRKTPAPSKQVP